MKLQHEDGKNYRSSKVTTHYDGHIRNLNVHDEGIVEVENKLQAQELQESHGKFKVIEGDESDLPDNVLEDKNVGEVKEYISEMGEEQLERLKELRSNEDRKTAIQAIDDRIEEIKRKQEKVVDADYEEVEEDENQEENQESGDEDGTENDQ